MNDRQLQQNLITELEFEPIVDAAHIGAALEGLVQGRRERDAVEHAAWSTPGVRRVEDRLRIV